MSLDLVLRYWGYIEADFKRFYSTNEPLLLSWRKFMILFQGLPPTSSFSLISGEERRLDAMNATERMEYYRKKHEDRQITGKELEKMANE